MRSLLAILAVVLAIPVAQAAEADARRGSVYEGVIRPGPPPLERFVGPLAITAAQKSKLEPLFAQAQAQAARDVAEATADGRKSEANELEATQRSREADFRLRLAQVLTPEQMSLYEQLTAAGAAGDRTAEMRSGHGHRESDTPATASERPDTSADRPAPAR